MQQLLCELSDLLTYAVERPDQSDFVEGEFRPELWWGVRPGTRAFVGRVARGCAWLADALDRTDMWMRGTTAYVMRGIRGAQ